VHQGGSGAGQVRASGFAENAITDQPKRDVPKAPKELPVKILSKPKPAYTAEARDLKLEGEVLVEVQFCAAGEIKILRVVKGLGHGLDEAAQQAAVAIRFKPAARDGAPVDTVGRVHIVFQLT